MDGSMPEFCSEEEFVDTPFNPIGAIDLSNFIIDSKSIASLDDSESFKEAKTIDIPTFGIIDSNTDPNVVDFPIPANDDSVKCIKLIMEYITGTINEETLKGKKDIDENTDTSENKETVES